MYVSEMSATATTTATAMKDTNAVPTSEAAAAAAIPTISTMISTPVSGSPATLPTHHKCVTQSPDGRLVVESGRPVPPLEPDMILVQTACVALNPNDYKMVDNFPSPGLTAGCDFAGTVVALGSAVPCRRDDRDAQGKQQQGALAVGDRVCGAVHGSNPQRPQVGAFGEFVTAYADCVLRLSATGGLSWAEAASIGGAVPATLGIALRETLHLPGDVDRPAAQPFFVLVWGGATANGTMAIQLLHRAGARVLATASPRSFDLVKSYGAEAVFDYRDPSCAEAIKTYTRNSLAYCLDIIGTMASMSKCYAAIGRAGGRYSSLEYFDPEAATTMRRAVKAEFVLGLSMSGEAIDLPGGYRSDPRPDRRALGKAWFASLQQILDSGELKPHPPRDLCGGLEAVPAGLEELRRGVSGIKLVSSLT